MNYLELVNSVLGRMREPAAATLVGETDSVILIVKDLVNDAKRSVEDAHTWNALRAEWDFDTVANQKLYPLVGAADNANIEYIYGESGAILRQRPLKDIKRLSAAGSSGNGSLWYAPNGRDSNGDMQIELYPVPTKVHSVTIGGFKRTPDLSADTDELMVPSKPVIYLALALAVRERGEVGGQTAGEIFGMANQFLSDAIAYDASTTDVDNIWMSV
jgi:hypothetical protein